MLRRLWSGDVAIVSCGGGEGLSLYRDKWFLQEACEANRSPVQRKRGNHFNWLRVFGQEPPSVAIRIFYADIFVNKVQADREMQLKAKNEHILEWRRALDNGAQEIEVWQCLVMLKKGKSSPDGATAEMVLALPESKFCALRETYKKCSPPSICRRHGFGSWRLSFSKKKKHIREASTSSVASVV